MFGIYRKQQKCFKTGYRGSLKSVVIMHQGGGVAAPVAGKILNEVIQYLGIEATEEIEENISQ